MHHFVYAAIGGSLLGVSAIMMMALNGRIAGISGILSGSITQKGSERWWRILFTAGIIIGAALPSLLSADFVVPEPAATLPLVLIGGLLVGLGTGLGSGCTTGHGICGIARLSKRSLVATCTFMAAAFLTVYILRHTFGA